MPGPGLCFSYVSCFRCLLSALASRPPLSTGDWLRSYDKLLPAMLDDGIRVMIYAGDLDLICNWVGNER